MEERLNVKKWGNSNGVRLSKSLMMFLDIKTNDTLSVVTEETDGKKRLIIEALKENTPEEISINELFADYNAEGIRTELQDLGESIGHEKW